MAKVIKRYGNRKLYDLDSSTYVTLHEIADMVKRGEDIQVIDNRTKEDLTATKAAFGKIGGSCMGCHKEHKED